MIINRRVFNILLILDLGVFVEIIGKWLEINIDYTDSGSAFIKKKYWNFCQADKNNVN